MAVAELIVSRRVLLGATLAIPVACVASPRRRGSSQTQRRQLGSGSSPEHGQGQRNNDQAPTVTNWDRALARFRRAEAALAAGAGADDDLFDRLLGRLNRALRRLLRVPAPNLPALAAKLDLLVAHQVWELDFALPSLAALRRDARRLAR